MSVQFANDFSLDWLEFTFGANSEDCHLFDSFLSLFPYVSEVLEERCKLAQCDKSGYYLEKARYGYRNALIFTEGFSVMWSYDRSDMGVHVTIPSHALAVTLPLLCGGLSDVKDCLSFLHDNGCRMTRVDLCFDDKSRRFIPADFCDFLRNEQIRTRCRRFGYYQSATGGTFTVGSRASGRYVRIYDKDGEQKVENGTFGTRYEVELRATYAEKMVTAMLLDSKYSFGDLINSIFEIVEPFNLDQVDISAARSHAALLPDWEKFLYHEFSAELKTVVFAPDRPDVKFESMIAFVDRSVSKALDIFSSVFGRVETLDLLQSLVCGKHDQLYSQRKAACENAKNHGCTLQDAYEQYLYERTSKLF